LPVAAAADRHAAVAVIRKARNRKEQAIGLPLISRCLLCSARLLRTETRTPCSSLCLSLPS